MSSSDNEPLRPINTRDRRITRGLNALARRYGNDWHAYVDADGNVELATNPTSWRVSNWRRPWTYNEVALRIEDLETLGLYPPYEG